jgi:glyoxylase-like metal-dependent hydrolase (beta-lactamase superfamily II)
LSLLAVPASSESSSRASFIRNVTADSREPQHFIDFVREKLNALRYATIGGGFGCIILFATTGSNSLAQKRTPLQTIDFLPGYETVNVIAELEPRSCTGRYAHPGAESAYVLEGAAVAKFDGKSDLISTPGHTSGSQSLLVHLKNSGFIILSGDVVHLEGNFEKSIVPSLNTNRGESIASMEKIRQLIGTYKATLFINHHKKQSDKLKLLPASYD